MSKHLQPVNLKGEGAHSSRLIMSWSTRLVNEDNIRLAEGAPCTFICTCYRCLLSSGWRHDFALSGLSTGYRGSNEQGLHERLPLTSLFTGGKLQVSDISFTDNGIDLLADWSNSTPLSVSPSCSGGRRPVVERLKRNTVAVKGLCLPLWVHQLDLPEHIANQCAGI